MYGKNESSIREVMKNKEKFRSSSFVAPHTAKVTAIACDSVNDSRTSIKFLVERKNLIFIAYAAL